jgi:hypothetical protein
MNCKQARLIERKQRRSDILEWYRYYKKDMKTSYSIQNGNLLGIHIYCMPAFGQKIAARLLCFKDKNYMITNGYMKFIIWKHKESQFNKKYNP